MYTVCNKLINFRPYDQDLWFFLHQLFMGLTILLTIAGFMVVVIDRGFDPLDLDQVKKNPHPAYGMVCFATVWIQPLMAILRPPHGSDKRWIFNVAHWVLGIFKSSI